MGIKPVANGGDGNWHYYVGRYTGQNTAADPLQIDTEVVGGAFDSIGFVRPPAIEKIGSTLVNVYWDAIGAQLRIRTSPDGIAWGVQFTPAALVGVAVRNGGFTLYNDAGTLYFFYIKSTDFIVRYITSTDGITWSAEVATDLVFQASSIVYTRNIRVVKFLGSWQFFWHNGSFTIGTIRNPVLNTGWGTTVMNCNANPPYTVTGYNGNFDNTMLGVFIRSNGQLMMTISFYGAGRRFTHKTSVDGTMWLPYTNNVPCPFFNDATPTADSPVPISGGVDNRGLAGAALLVPNFSGAEITWAANKDVDPTRTEIGDKIQYSVIGAAGGLNINTVYGQGAAPAIEDVGGCLTGDCVCPPPGPNVFFPTGTPITSKPGKGDAFNIKTPVGRVGSSKPVSGSAKYSSGVGSDVKIPVAMPIAAPTSVYSSFVLADSPLGYWKLNELIGTVVTDSSGNLRHGSYGGGVTLGVPSVLPRPAGEYAARFNGTSGFISIPLNLSALTAMTLEFWMKVASFPGGDKLVAEFTTNYNVTEGGFIVDPNPGAGAAQFAMAQASTYKTRNYTNPTINAWHHYVYQFIRGVGVTDLHVYIDGVIADGAVSGADKTGTFANNTLYLMSRAGASLFLAGDLDEVAIYSGALSAARILAHYNAGIS
jgi:hypothetical protein